MLLFLPCLCALTSKSIYACISYSKECGHSRKMFSFMKRENWRGILPNYFPLDVVTWSMSVNSSSAAVGSRVLGPSLIHVRIASFQEEHRLLPIKSPCSHWGKERPWGGRTTDWWLKGIAHLWQRLSTCTWNVITWVQVNNSKEKQSRSSKWSVRAWQRQKCGRKSGAAVLSWLSLNTT